MNNDVPSRLLASIALALLASCAGGNATVYVDVVTDLCPDVDGGPRCLEDRFDDVRVSLDRTLSVGRAPRASDDYVDGQRVAELSDVEPRTYVLSVELFERGVLVARATRELEVREAALVVRVPIQSACAGVSCPDPAGDPALTECVSGACVDPGCFDGGGASCGALCESDAGCTASVACGEVRCVEHVCLELLRDERCAAGERCIAGIGCFGGVLEGDPCATDDDCGATDFICCGRECHRPDCDDGNVCTEDACTRSGCVNQPIDAACDDHVYCNGADACGGGTCSVHAGDPCGGGTTCDEASGMCFACVSDADCPAASEAPIDACGGFADVCAESGTQTWRVTSYRCAANACVADARDEARACARSRAGVPCGAGESTCSGGACVCGSTSCGFGTYCNGGACWALPRYEAIGQPSPDCVDLARGPDPGVLMGYRIYGRPGARVHKYNRHASCPGAAWEEAPETASSPVYLDASGVYEVLLDSATPLACDFANLGLYEQYAEVDAIRVPEAGVIEQVMYNTSAGCASALATCISARSYCP